MIELDVKPKKLKSIILQVLFFSPFPLFSLEL